MVGDIVGYAHIKKDPIGMSAESLDKFSNKTCRVFEFDSDGGCLCVNPEGTAFGMFDKSEILGKFECNDFGDYIMPPNLNMIEKISYVAKLQLRKGGYNYVVKNMVIVSSINKGVYTDEFLFQKQ